MSYQTRTERSDPVRAESELSPFRRRFGGGDIVASLLGMLTALGAIVLLGALFAAGALVVAVVLDRSLLWTGLLYVAVTLAMALSSSLTLRLRSSYSSFSAAWLRSSH